MLVKNFSIIAHIDHGKSTLADRILEITGTIDKRKMEDQVLDSMELEKERGITIKLAPVHIKYNINKDKKDLIQILGDDTVYFNLIDTPGHIDFAYEVSRSLRAVEAVVLLVDATQGVQAQTISVLDMAKEAGLMILPVINKVDSPLANIEETEREIKKLLRSDGIEYTGQILHVSGKTGQGVENLLDTLATLVPPPQTEDQNNKKSRAMLFDFEYSDHQGVIIYARILNGNIKKGDDLKFIASNKDFIVKEVGIFCPQKTPSDKLSAGDIGYIVTGLKEPGVAIVGDTITNRLDGLEPFPGYGKPIPIVFASIYPEYQEDFDDLRAAFGKLKLSDSSLIYEEETSGILGRGFRCGFLGMLHLEIVTERLRREYNLELIVTMPSVTYEVVTKQNPQLREKIFTPIHFPEHGNILEVYEPWVNLFIITPSDYISPIMETLYEYEGEVLDMEDWSDDRVRLSIEMPLRELMRNYFDRLKSMSSGYASISYKMGEMRRANVDRLDIYLAEEMVPAFSRIVSSQRIEKEAEDMTEKLYKILPPEWFKVKIQAYVKGRIIASRTKSALQKDVAGYLYGGDITRKMKLREKQKEGKKRMQAEGKVTVTHDTFLKMMKGD